MSRNITLHQKHGLAPALMICPLCGQHTNGLALLGHKADRVMKELGQKDGYKEYGHNEIPDSEPCDRCKGVLSNSGVIFISKSTGESLILNRDEVENFKKAIGHIIMFDKIVGHVVELKKPFWVCNDGTIAVTGESIQSLFE